MIIRWVCEKDNKKWIYPVEKCIYCKGPIKKQVSKKAKVVGVTKVNIASPLHPIVPYNVLLLEDEYGNRMPKKTMKEYTIGNSYSIEKAKTYSAVVIKKIKYDLGEALKESLDLLNSIDLEEGDKVLIKPSAIEPAYPYQAVNTNPHLLEEVIKFFNGKGITDIVVGEQPMLGNDISSAAAKSGIMDVCSKHKIRVVDLGKTEYIEKESGNFKFQIAKEVIERKVINLPAMKTNSQIVISGAVENMIRATSPQTQKDMFYEGIEKTLPELIKALPKFITIGDATLGMQGDGPTAMGEPAFLNILYVSKDPVALDAVFVETGMLPKPHYLKNAQNIGAGISEIGKIEVVGDEMEAAKFHLKCADNDPTPHPRIKLIDGKADPYIFNSAIKMSSMLIGIPGYYLYLAIGRYIDKSMVAGKSRIVAYGKDAISKLKEMKTEVIASIPESVSDTEKTMMLKGVLEDPINKSFDASTNLDENLKYLAPK